MDRASVKVLFLSEGANSYFRLRQHLEQLGCQCWAASCAEEGLGLLDHQTFDLLLSTHPVHLASALIARLERSRCSAFYRLQVEDGYWWVPILECGTKCLGTPALRPTEFLETIDRIVSETRLGEPFAVPGPHAIAA